MPTLEEYLIGLTHSEKRVSWTKMLPSGTALGFHVMELRRENTGIHGLVAVGLEDGTPPAYDEFNLKRDNARNHLAGRAHKRLPSLDAQSYSREELDMDLDLVCWWVLANWEKRSFDVETFDHDTEVPELVPLLRPYVYDGMGTILFAPPGQGKSYIMQLMSICMANGLEFPWACAPSPVLYVSLERSKRTLQIRERSICKALGIDGMSNVSYLHSRGHSLKAVIPKMHEFAENNPGCVVMLDSITRAGMGTMVEDTTANTFIDEMNKLPSWLALAHTPKSDSTVLYGSMGYEAGEDIGIHLQGERRGNKLGIKLEMVKVNDLPRAAPEYLSLEFGSGEGEGLMNIRRANRREFPGLQLTNRDILQQIRDLCTDHGRATATYISENTDIPRTTVLRYLDAGDTFYKHPAEGREVYYSVKSSATEGY